MRRMPSQWVLAVYSGALKLSDNILLAAKVVDRVKLHLLNDPDQVGTLSKAAAMQH